MLRPSGPTPPPAANIRRFDVLAEWSRLTGQEKHQLTEPQARAYGIAVAGILSVRTLAGHTPNQVAEWKRLASRQEIKEAEVKDAEVKDAEAEVKEKKQAAASAWWEQIGTPIDFNRKVIARMGTRFYREAFQPALRAAWEAGKKYEAIQDSIREPWNAPSSPDAPV